MQPNANDRMRQEFLKGVLGNAINPILATAGFNIRWLMRWLVVFWRWILSDVRRLLYQTDPVRPLNFTPAAA